MALIPHDTSPTGAPTASAPASAPATPAVAPELADDDAERDVARLWIDARCDECGAHLGAREAVSGWFLARRHGEVSPRE